MLFVKDDLMRVQHWLTAIVGIALLLPCGNEASAQGQPGYFQQPSGWPGSQGPYPQSIFYGSGPGNGGMATEPAFFPDHQGGFTPSMSPLLVNPAGQAGYQSGMQPWPTISPYQGPAYSELYNSHGMWNYDFNSNRRRYTGSVEYLRSRVRKPNGNVGHPAAQRYKDIILPIMHEEPIGLDDLADAFQGDAPNEDFLLEATTDQVGFWPNTGQPGFNLYDRSNASDVGYPTSNGLRIRWGFIESDDTGFMIDGWWTGEGVAEFDAQNATPGRSLANPSLILRVIDNITLPLAPFTFEEIFDENLLNLRGLPINDGTVERLPDGTVLGGTSIPYDLEFRLKYKTETAGTSVNYLMMPIIKKKHFKVRPLLGARYVYLKEQFNFFGHDSGLTYDNQTALANIFPQLKLHSLPNGIDENGDGTNLLFSDGHVEWIAAQELETLKSR